jgi:hypothetical protein
MLRVVGSVARDGGAVGAQGLVGVGRVQSIAEGREVADAPERERRAPNPLEAEIRGKGAGARVDRVVVPVGIVVLRNRRPVSARRAGRAAGVGRCDIGTSDGRRRPRRARASEQEQQDCWEPHDGFDPRAPGRLGNPRPHAS